jgi:hypothetical protein
MEGAGKVAGEVMEGAGRNGRIGMPATIRREAVREAGS